MDNSVYKYSINRHSFRLGITSSLKLLLSLLLSIVVVANAAAAEKIPRLKDKPDFSGIWQTTSAADYDLEPHSPRIDAPPGPGVVEGGAIPYLPQALAQRKKNFENRNSEIGRAHV